MCLCKIKYQWVVSHHFGGVLTSLKKVSRDMGYRSDTYPPILAFFFFSIFLLFSFFAFPCFFCALFLSFPRILGFILFPSKARAGGSGDSIAVSRDMGPLSAGYPAQKLYV